MDTETPNLVICFRHDKYLPCIQYVFDLFARTYGFRPTYVAEGQPIPPGDVIIHYTVYDASANPAFGMPAIIIHRSEFFDAASDKSLDRLKTAPEKFGEILAARDGVAFQSLAQIAQPNAVIHQDIVATSFILLSGYYDHVLTERDQYGRLRSDMVPLPHETWEKPLVNHLFRQLDQLVRYMIVGESALPDNVARPPDMQTICLTHDVDLFRKYNPKSMLRHLARTAKNSPTRLPTELRQSVRALTRSVPDPYDSYDQLYMLKERVSAPSTFFFLGSQPCEPNGDYHVTDHECRGLFTRARTFGDEIAMHGSWESGIHPGQMKVEKEAIESAASTTVQGARQHYLRFTTPDTWKHLATAGVRYDSTGGFPDRAGFKYGWSGCFHPFDLIAMEPLPILEIPLVCMDVTIANYEKIPAELALERLTNLMDAACDNVPGGAFVFLWHNIMGDRAVYPGYWDTFEYFFSVASGSARFVTLSQLCDEYEGG